MEQEKELLERLEGKLQIVRDRTQGVAEGYTPGMYLWGPGGTSKSFTVEETLKRVGKPYKLSNSRITGKGLFELLSEYPDVVHVLEDVETLLADKNAQGVLRSALGGQSNEEGLQERPVVWQTAGHRNEFVFSGGIIMVGNCKPEDLPQLRAIGTRIPFLEYKPTNEELAAFMRKIARAGHRHGRDRLSPEECMEVADEIIARSQRLKRNLDLRLLVNTFQDRLQWANGAAETPWRDMLKSRMEGRVVTPSGNYESRAGRKNRELAIARRIGLLPRQQRQEAWKKQTGKSEKALYRRLQELERGRPQFSHFSRFSRNDETEN